MATYGRTNTSDISIDDKPIASTAKLKDRHIQQQRRRLLIAFLALLVAVLLITGFDPARVAIAAISSFAILSIGLVILGAMARPVPEPPPPGELRKVRLAYRCSSCGTELRMTLANDQVPESPRHCGDNMDLLTSTEDI